MTLSTYTEAVDRILPGTEREILLELIGVLEAVEEREYALTRSGIPPKPLWSAINERLLWADPVSLLHDWDECDQVRFVYALCEELRLIEPDRDGVLKVGGGADPFFLAAPLVRARMLRRAWVEVIDWDERCDARDEEGYRFNFGRTYRRDFLRGPAEVREVLLDALRESPVGEFVRARALAARVSGMDPGLLISEEDSLPRLQPGQAHPEIHRLVAWWIFMAARFGWVDLARMPDPDLDADEARLYRLNSWGARVLDDEVAAGREGHPSAEPGPFILQPTGEILFMREEGDVGDEYLLRRVAAETPSGGWSEPAVTCRLTAESVRGAIDRGVDPQVFEERVLARSRTEVPDTIENFFREALRDVGRCTLHRGVSAVEIAAGSDALIAALEAAGFAVRDGLVLASWDRWEELVAVLGEEPVEGFRYPSDVPLAKAKGADVSLEYPVLPLAGRELLEAAGFSGETLRLTFDEERLAELAKAGFSREAVRRGLEAVVDGKLPKL